MEKSLTPARIEKVLRVVDTREFEEVGDRWVPIVGSGTEHNCARCGRLHEIHATVLLSDATETVVGVGCMKGESIELALQVRSGAARATRIAKLQAEIARDAALVPYSRELERETRAAFAPEFTIETRERRPGLEREREGATFQVLSCGPAHAWLVCGRVDSPALRAELRELAEQMHVQETFRRAGLRRAWNLEEDLARNAKRLAKLEAATLAEVAP